MFSFVPEFLSSKFILGSKASRGSKKFARNRLQVLAARLLSRHEYQGAYFGSDRKS